MQPSRNWKRHPPQQTRFHFRSSNPVSKSRFYEWDGNILSSFPRTGQEFKDKMNVNPCEHRLLLTFIMHLYIDCSLYYDGIFWNIKCFKTKPMWLWIEKWALWHFITIKNTWSSSTTCLALMSSLTENAERLNLMIWKKTSCFALSFLRILRPAAQPDAICTIK